MSKKSGELYHYHLGFFEAYSMKKDKHGEYSTHHVLKVIPDDAIQVEIEMVDDGYQITKTGDRIQWETVDLREEMELQLLERNKRHLKQVVKEDGIPMQEWFQKLIGGDGYSNGGGKLLSGDVNWREIPDNKEIREWIKALICTPAETTLPKIKGNITTKEFQRAFAKAKDNT